LERVVQAEQVMELPLEQDVQARKAELPLLEQLLPVAAVAAVATLANSQVNQHVQPGIQSMVAQVLLREVVEAQGITGTLSTLEMQVLHHQQ
jgi:hypothetical protein